MTHLEKVYNAWTQRSHNLQLKLQEQRKQNLANKQINQRERIVLDQKYVGELVTLSRIDGYLSYRNMQIKAIVRWCEEQLESLQKKRNRIQTSNTYFSTQRRLAYAQGEINVYTTLRDFLSRYDSPKPLKGGE